MNEFKLVPVEPTSHMLQAACDEEQRPIPMWSRMKAIYTAMLAAAPAVQGEPVAWVTADTVDGQAVNGKPRRIWWENNEGVGMPIYAAPQPTEQQPAPDVSGLVEALEMARDRIESERRSGEWDPLLEDIDDVLAAHRNQGDGK